MVQWAASCDTNEEFSHDQCRSVDRYTTPVEKYRDRAAKLLCLLQTTLSGTQFVFQGKRTHRVGRLTRTPRACLALCSSVGDRSS